MTKIIFYKTEECFKGFEISGHIDGPEAGHNPLCAAISVASQMAVLGIKEELKLNPTLKIGDGYLKMVLKDKDFGNSGAQLLIKTCFETLKQIEKQNKKQVKLEVKENV